MHSFLVDMRTDVLRGSVVVTCSLIVVLGAVTSTEEIQMNHGANANGDARDVWDGVYTVEQAQRGATAYRSKCMACHLANLGGDTTSPALVGVDFVKTWEGKRLRNLYSRIISTMPVDSPGTLSESVVVDLVAHLLERNGFPPGTAELRSANELNAIAMSGKKDETKE